MAKYGDHNYMEANFINHALIESILDRTQNATDEIIDQIEPTVEIVQRIRPVYNFKASD